MSEIPEKASEISLTEIVFPKLFRPKVFDFKCGLVMNLIRRKATKIMIRTSPGDVDKDDQLTIFKLNIFRIYYESVRYDLPLELINIGSSLRSRVCMQATSDKD